MAGRVRHTAEPSPRTESGQPLRQRAEARLRAKTVRSPGDLEPLSSDAMRAVLHDLRVHQIELEMQNEELRRTQVELDASRARYFDLYDLAPVSLQRGNVRPTAT